MMLQGYNILLSTYKELSLIRGEAWASDVFQNCMFWTEKGAKLLFICEATFIEINKKYGFENEPLPVPHIPRGVGDSIAKLTHGLGIRTPLHNLTGGGCGCAGRQTSLNNLLPYTPNPDKTT